MTAKEYLQQVKKIDTQLKNKNFELKQAEELEIPAKPIVDEIVLLQKEKNSIIKVIEQLPEAEYDVLHLIYVQYLTMKEVAAERDISCSSAANIHGRALEMIDKIING